jgi:hypothetical protein
LICIHSMIPLTAQILEQNSSLRTSIFREIRWYIARKAAQNLGDKKSRHLESYDIYKCKVSISPLEIMGNIVITTLACRNRPWTSLRNPGMCKPIQ